MVNLVIEQFISYNIPILRKVGIFMLVSDKEYLETFETGDEAKKKRMIDHMGLEQADLLHDAGYKVYVGHGKICKVVSKDGKEAWYCSNYDPAWENN